MKSIFQKSLLKIGVFFLMVLPAIMKANEEKFNMGENEPTDKGPMFFAAIAGSVAVFSLLLFLKIRYDKQKKEQIKKQLKMQAKNFNPGRSRANGRVAASRGRTAAS